MNFVLDEGAFAPEYAHDIDAGIDLRSPYDLLVPGSGTSSFGEYSPGYAVIDTGVHIQLPVGTVGFLKSKSGLNVKHNIVSEGVIDQGYTGSIVVKLYNHGTSSYKINKGDKITQLVVLPVIHVDLNQVESLDDSERGDSGFGSTGK